uniref:DM2 domain-containing protein n=1 Tax=viral metagenome TaxID=1070528 RepID=A0A6C0CPX2_9ZZZZ
MDPVEQTVTTTVSVEDTTVLDNENLTDGFDGVLGHIETLSKELRTMSVQMKNMKKKYTKELKTLRKKRKVRILEPEDGSAPAPKKEPSGFVSPIEISDELAQFLGEPCGILIPRTAVTKRVIAFIKEHSLGDKKNGRNFDLTDPTNPNALVLKALFGIERGDEVGYFNLQTYLKHHFKSAKSALAASISSPNESIDQTQTDVADLKPKKKRILKKST